MTAADYFGPIIQSVSLGIGALLTGIISIYVPRAINAFETRTGIQLTAQQQQTLIASAMTAKGILETKIDQGVLRIGHINVSDPVVRAEAAAALARVPDAAAALRKDLPSMAETIVGLVDTNRIDINKPLVILPATAPPAAAPLAQPGV